MLKLLFSPASLEDAEALRGLISEKEIKHKRKFHQFQIFLGEAQWCKNDIIHLTLTVFSLQPSA